VLFVISIMYWWQEPRWFSQYND